jgi:hypothetical protein
MIGFCALSPGVSGAAGCASSCERVERCLGVDMWEAKLKAQRARSAKGHDVVRTRSWSFRLGLDGILDQGTRRDRNTTTSSPRASEQARRARSHARWNHSGGKGRESAEQRVERPMIVSGEGRSVLPAGTLRPPIWWRKCTLEDDGLSPRSGAKSSIIPSSTNSPTILADGFKPKRCSDDTVH